MKLWNEIKEAMIRHPYQKICEDDSYMTFEEIAIFSEIYARKLVGEKCCAILCDSEMVAAMALLSCFAAGVTAVPLSKRYGVNHCRKILEFISPTAIITDLNGTLQITKISDSKYEEPEIHPALIMCTSGTTGTPKGVMLTEENILANVTDIIEYFNIKEKDSILIARPLYHCAVLTGEFLTSIFKGVKIRFYPYNFNPRDMIKIINSYGITVFCGTPTLLNLLSRFKRVGDCCSLNSICISGECMGIETGNRIADAFPNTNIYHVYGLTEASPRVSYLPPSLFREYPDSVGVLLNSVMLAIVRPDATRADVCEEGVLWLKGKSIMSGYYNNPELTSKVLQNGWLCTGDIAFVDRQGLLRIKGRNDDLIIRAGLNIYPQEIESSLKEDPRVKETLVYKVDTSTSGVQIGLKISGDFVDKDEIRQLCLNRLASFQIPTVIELVDEIPKNGSGKIIRR